MRLARLPWKRGTITQGRGLARVKAQDFSVADAIVENTTDKGYTLYIGPDLIYSIVHIQHGSYVPRQTRTARYDTAAGIVLDVQHDRVSVPGEEEHTRAFEGSVPGETQTRVFLEPIGDELEVSSFGQFFILVKAGHTPPSPLVLAWKYSGGGASFSRYRR